jgi:hypothetical protein
MRTIEQKIYKFNELSQKAKDKALEDHFNFLSYAIDLSELIYYGTIPDLLNKLKIESKTDFINNIKIYSDSYGVVCNIELPNLDKYSVYTESYIKSDLQDLVNELTQNIKNVVVDYFKMISTNDFLIESIESNDYEFTQDGTIFN